MSNNVHTLRKIISPALPPNMLHREGLVRRLNDVIVGSSSGSTENVPTCKLVLLHAPAGYGKTTLLADFARQTTLPCCWYVLDSSDADKVTFLGRLLASIRQRFPQFGTALDALLAGAIAQAPYHSIEARLETVVKAFVEALETELSERFALILCNYHEVNTSAEINAFINALLQSPFPGVVILESRAIPDLDFASLLMRREVFGMSSELLRLSTQEIRELAALQGVTSLSNTEVERLATAFDGWITGILLGTHLGDVHFLQSRKGATSLLSESIGISVDQQFLFAYLVNEVFSYHPDAYAFLKNVCVLQEMTPSLCDALLESTDASVQLHYLEQHGLFVTHSGAGSQMTYVCHPVLRELLADELRCQAPERFALLHHKAAELLSNIHDYERAITHALAAGAEELAVRLILAASEQLFTQGHVETLARWIDALPVPLVNSSAKLLLLRARLHCMAGDYPQALPLLAAAQEAICQSRQIDPGEFTTIWRNRPAKHVPMLQLRQIDPGEFTTMQAEIALMRGNILYHKGAYHEAQKCSQQVLASLPADEIVLRAEAYMRLGVCANYLGDLSSSTTHLQKALQLLGRHPGGYQAADVHSALVSTYVMLGNFALAEHHLGRALAYRERLQDGWGKSNDLIRLGVIKTSQGAFAEAETALTEALRLATFMHLLRGQAYALSNLSRLYEHQELYDRSLALSEDALVLARQIEDTYLINFTLCIMAMTYLYMGDAATAELLVAEVDVPLTDQETTRYERTERDVTYGTILFYQHRYEEACICLSKLEATMHTVGLKLDQMQVQLRLAACYLAQERTIEAVRYLEKVATILTTFGDYEQMAHLELQRLPALKRMVETLPTLARLRALLHLETEAHELQASTEALPPAFDARLTVSNPRLRILALGEPTVLLDDKPLTRWRMARAMELFFYLLDCARPMRKEQIITALWSEVDEQIDHTFHSTVYYLRKAVGESCLVSKGGTYALTLSSQYGSNVWYDVTTFQEWHKKTGEALDKANDIATREAFEAMVALYQGDYLQSFYSDWCLSRRDELRRAYLDALQHLAHLAWREGQYDESASHWQHMLALDNCLEEAHYGLMCFYLQRGKRGLALRQYQRCRDTLQQELGVQPGPGIQNLYKRLTESSAS